MRRLALGWLIVVVAAAPAQDKSPTAVTLKVYAAAAPVPAMKHLLLPPVSDLQPGNAALFYQRAHSPEWFRGLERMPWLGKVSDWLEMPARQMPASDARQVLEFTGIFKELDRAARCASCDWQMNVRLREDGIALLMPELQGFRQFAQLLAVKARLEAIDGHPEDALRTLQTGLAFGRHVGECPIVINALVGQAITQIMLGSIEELIQQPGAPNLYWALRDLPEPFIDLRRPLQGERLAVDALWPEVRQALGETKFQPLPVATLRASLNRILGLAQPDGRVTAATVVALAHPKALAYFRAQGHAQEELESLPVTQVVLMYVLTQWDRWHDATYRWHNVPYWQARAGLKKAVQERKESLRSSRETLLLLQNLLPANEDVFFHRARLQRRLAALECVEAIRLYAAAHDDKLPESLDDIRDVPIPIDPMSGKAFEYEAGNGTARLYGPAPPGEIQSDRTVVLYQISIVKSGKGTP